MCTDGPAIGKEEVQNVTYMKVAHKLDFNDSSLILIAEF